MGTEGREKIEKEGLFEEDRGIRALTGSGLRELKQQNTVL